MRDKDLEIDRLRGDLQTLHEKLVQLQVAKALVLSHVRLVSGTMQLQVAKALTLSHVRLVSGTVQLQVAKTLILSHVRLESGTVQLQVSRCSCPFCHSFTLIGHITSW